MIEFFIYRLRAERPYKKLLLLYVIGFFLSTTIGNLLTKIDSSKLKGSLENETVLFQFVVGVLLAPIIETYIFQYLIIYSLKKHIKQSAIRFFLSVLLFGVAHHYNWSYVLYGLAIGLVFATSFVLYNNVKAGFVYTCTLHALFNLTAFIEANYL